jgi:SAM-dependent methyltransferase
MTPQAQVSDTTVPEVFDRALEGLLAHDVHGSMDALRATLRFHRAHARPDEWAAVGQEVRRHRLHGLLLESPFAQRAYCKPRGYAGDAVLMDLIYGTDPPGRDISPLGAMLHGYEFDSPCFQSVRARRAILAREIDRVAAERPGARVLSVACGHLREAEWSRAVRERAVTLTAVDQDPESLAVTARDYGIFGVCAVPGTVGEILRRSVRFHDFDLVYAGGLFDYLPPSLGRALTTSLFRMLAPGGHLLIGNFTPDAVDAAYMEAVMDWPLVWRDEQEMLALTHSLPGAAIDAIDQFRDVPGNVTYLRVVRR